MLGGYPDQAALWEQGRVDSPLCPLCGEEQGTHQHLYYRCEADVCQRARAPLVAAADKGT